jgi:hypothetical protein
MNKTFEFRWENGTASIVLMNPDFEVIPPCDDLARLREEYDFASNELWFAFCQASEKLTVPDTTRFRGKPLGDEYFEKHRTRKELPPQDTGK